MFTLEEVTIQKDLVGTLLNRLKTKDEKKYQVVWMVVIDGKRQSEVADHFGVSRETVRLHLYKGLRIMRDHLAFSLRVKELGDALH